MLTIKETMTGEEKAQVEKINRVIVELSQDPDILAYVNMIESGIKTTKGNYGRYMQFLSPYANDKTALYIMSKTLVLAGADRFGVDSAVSILKG